MAVITLLTDFGTQDEYAGVLKGAILSTDPAAVIVDLSHGIFPGDVGEAALMLASSYAFFPRGSIHLAVVDPGVGTARDIIGVQCHDHFFLAPNNGLLWPVLENCSSAVVHQVENQALFRQPVSRTFHGRDIFAPVAGHLSKGASLSQLGRRFPAARIQAINVKASRGRVKNEIHGTVVSVDRFGNLLTNITAGDLGGLKGVKALIDLAGHHIEGLAETYAGSPSAEPIAIIGSRGCLEIAVNGGSAAHCLNIGKGAPVSVRMCD